MDQVAENRERSGVGVFERERDGIANAETHTEVSRPDDTHFMFQSILQCKLCQAEGAWRRAGIESRPGWR